MDTRDASRMSPCSDHGERSYRGSGRRVGRRASIAGAEAVELSHAACRMAVPLPVDVRDEASLARSWSPRLGGLDILVDDAARPQACRSPAEPSAEDLGGTFLTAQRRSGSAVFAITMQAPS